MLSKCPLFARSPGSDTTRPAPATPPPPLSSLLKAQTQPQHDEAEHHPLHAVLLGGQNPPAAREAYTRLLGQHLAIQEVFEPLLRAAATSPVFGALIRPHHYHLEGLREDIAAMGASADQARALPATVRFIEMITSSAGGDGAALLGVFYVFEGSTNGGTIIGKRMKDLLQLGGEAGTRFINPHGPLVRARWGEWKQTLDGLTLDAPQRDAIIAAACETFRQSHAVLSDVHQAMRAAGGVPEAVVMPRAGMGAGTAAG